MSENIDNGMDINMCLKKVLNTAYNHVKACMGAKETLKALAREEDLKLVVLAKDLHQNYNDVILAKCQKANVPVIYLESREELASIFPVKCKKAGAIAVRDFVHETPEKELIMSTLK